MIIKVGGLEPLGPIGVYAYGFVGDSHVATMYWDAGPHPPREERDNFSGHLVAQVVK